MPNEVHQHPDGFIYIRTDDETYGVTLADFALDAGAAFPALPEGGTERIYSQGVRHAIIVNEKLEGGEMPWPYGADLIERVGELMTAKAAREEAAAAAAKAAREAAFAALPVTVLLRYQFFAALAGADLISQAEAIAAAANGAVPPAMETALATLPGAAQFPARIRLASAPMIERAEPVVVEFLKNLPDPDAFWRNAAAAL